jgi:two-component system cell cycle sensor histidine kinase/response regulator CckA
MTPSVLPDTQRMAALAQVAGGISPVLSDALTVIRGQAGVLLDKAGHDAGTLESLRQIYAAAERACSLVRQLQIFGRHQTAHTGVMDLNGFIDETGGVIRQLMGENISVEFRLAADLPRVLADPDMMEQVLIIFTLNARDAMPAGGRLSFGTEAVDVTDGAVKDRAEGRSGRFVVMRVDDTGRGIAPEIMSRIFEPFFTTKLAGRSAGLGLATVFGIVQQHHGWMTVESAVNAGSSFKVFLPVAPAGSMVESDRESGTGTGPGDSGVTILLVEDEVAVREFTVMVLQAQGFRVLQAGSGADALEVWKWHGARVGLLLTDMVLEDHMSGLELAAKLRAENPRLRVICTSGQTREDMKRFPEPVSGYLFLQKPCRPKNLVAAVRALLDEKQP